MSYVIPQTRGQAIEIYKKLIFDRECGLADTIPPELTKYHMFIGALTECSDKEFKDYIELLAQTNTCAICFEESLWCKHCELTMKELFNTRWNE